MTMTKADIERIIKVMNDDLIRETTGRLAKVMVWLSMKTDGDFGDRLFFYSMKFDKRRGADAPDVVKNYRLRDVLFGRGQAPDL